VAWASEKIVNRLKSVNRLRQFLRDYNAKSRWKFPELPPADLHRWLALDLGLVDDGELERVQWLWKRKPRVVLGENMLGYLLLVSVGVVFLFIPQLGLPLDGVWLLAIFSLNAAETVRTVRWRRDYEAAVWRLARARRAR
jgi:hypothetical protein